MDFLKTCTTNAQALGDYEAIAYQAFSVTRHASPPAAHPRDWSPCHDLRAVEAGLRQRRHLIAQDASRPWLWHFRAITVDMVAQDSTDLPALDGYRFQREQAGAIKASEMARPPMRPGNPHAFANPATTPSAVVPQKGTQPGATDQHQALDCFVIYELFASSVTALISFFLVSKCGVVALNYRTLVSKSIAQQEQRHRHSGASLHWLTSIHVHWVSSGTLLASTSTAQTRSLRCLDDTSEEEEKLLIGACVRIAPNAMLASIASFEHPLAMAQEDHIDGSRRGQKKKAKTTSLDQNIEKWKAAVQRWLGWRGYSLPNLHKKSAWVRIRIDVSAQTPLLSPGLNNSDPYVFWPRALCFVSCFASEGPLITETLGVPSPPAFQDDLKWFEASGSSGFRDPLDVAQDWFVGKLERDKMLDARRRAKKAEEDALRRKDEPSGLYPSSPFNPRTGVYGDLQPVSGVYPTPPDGIAPGTGFSSTDTPSVSGTIASVILAPGGNIPAINLSAPQNDNQQQPSTSPAFPSTMEPFQTSGEDDDLFEDMQGDAYNADGVEEADFDFFDGPDGDDIDMADAPDLPRNDAQIAMQRDRGPQTMVISEPSVQEEMSDPLTALENALSASYPLAKDKVQGNNDGERESETAPVNQGSIGRLDSRHVSPPVIRNDARPKEPTPPLSPGLIANALQPSPPRLPSVRHVQTPAPLERRGNAFHSLDFSRRMSLVDAKYQGGRFANHSDMDTDVEGIPSATRAGRVKSLRDLPLLTSFRYAASVASRPKIPEIMPLARAVSDNSESDTESDVSDVSEVNTDGAAITKPPPLLDRLVIPAKRKIPTEGHGTPLSVTSYAESLAGDCQDSNGLQLDEASLALFEPDTRDWAMVDLPSPAERSSTGARYAIPSLAPATTQVPDTPTSQPEVHMDLPDQKPLNGKENIFITQIITDQIVSATLDLLEEDCQQITPCSSVPSAEARWQSHLKELFPKATECTLPALVAIHDVFPDLSAQAKGQQRPPPRKPNESNTVPSNHIYQINPPFIRVRRAETHWDLLPPSIAFWEPLGLAPVSPPKNVVAFCVHPHSDALRPILDRFLLNVQLAYDTCKLGTHARVETVMEYENGLVPVMTNSLTSPKDAFKALKETCIQLGKLLAIQHPQIKEKQDCKIDAFVVYMVDPFGNPAALWELCSAFWALFQAYGQGPPGRADPNQKPDLVLQVVPIKYLASFHIPVVLDASTFVNLAREVYDRCPPSATSTDKTPLSIYKAPAFHLEESLPRNIQFKLISEPPQDLLRENSYMHLAYAISLDGSWVTAAWTDSSGKSQAVVSYHLGTRVFGDIAKEIWQTTIELLQSRRVQWRVCIVKAGTLDREELETWVLLITCPTQVNLFLTLLTVVEDSPYNFTPAVSTTTSSSGHQSVNTPGSTPQAGVSPDPAVGLTPAATPSGEAMPDLSADPEARLVDVTDETWGIVLAHRLHNSNSTNQFSPALISGLLVKRGKTQATSNSIHHSIPDPCPGPITTAINILWIGAVGSTRTATSPFPPASDGVSPGGFAAGGNATPSPSPAQERSTSSLMWTPTVQTRSTAENLLKEILAQFRALGLLAKLRGMRGTRHGSLPWHIVAAKRGVEGLSRVTGGPV
ncbi:mediator complex subunit 13 C-terminal-domain-containing protein [Ampelomyces quisqualis]|uniref:Mediator of RNA polymerase II transcription subunit 13 n=1 Tax=Ampelomyces quisqualis TaxID=50730 RepID=A0A6A5QB83_AMPQU|nr:mediator complex subunit 13 C-terminal-domain-containing protein [Ampelomyces quisqualis]